MHTPTRILARVSGALLAAGSLIGHAAAQVFNGPGITEGLNAASAIAGLPDGDVRSTVVNIVQRVLSFLALAAVITIIIAGIWLIVGLGSDESKERAKKIILYTLIGLIVVLFARVIVGLVTVFLAGQVA